MTSLTDVDVRAVKMRSGRRVDQSDVFSEGRVAGHEKSIRDNINKADIHNNICYVEYTWSPFRTIRKKVNVERSPEYVMFL